MKRLSAILLVRKLSVIAVLATLASIGATGANSGKKDTANDVIRAGKEASEGLSTMEAALKDAQAIAARLQEPEVAARLLELAQRKDLKGLSDLLKGAASSSQIQVKSVGDIVITITILIGTKGYQLCIGDCEHPSGAKGGVVFQESR